jgi:hypothetical protein
MYLGHDYNVDPFTDQIIVTPKTENGGFYWALGSLFILIFCLLFVPFSPSDFSPLD